MAVTSRLKMQHAVMVQIDYTGFTRQTTYFHHKNRDWLANNWVAGAALVEGLVQEGRRFERAGSHWVVNGVSVERVLAFLQQYVCHEDHTDLRREFLRKYIEKQNGRGECRLWTVAVVTLANEAKPKERLGTLEVTPVNRSKLHDRGVDSADLGTITTQANFGFDLPAEARPAAVGDANKKRQPRRPAGTEPLLLLVPIDKDSEPSERSGGVPVGRPRNKLEAAGHVLGLALAFPDSQTKRVGENYIQVELPEVPVYLDAEEISIDEDDG